jgi:hypothetical protein
MSGHTANAEHGNCGKCGGSKDSEGWCRNYCTNDDAVQVFRCRGCRVIVECSDKRMSFYVCNSCNHWGKKP